MSVSAAATPPARHQLPVRPGPIDAATGVDEAPEGVLPGGEGIIVIHTNTRAAPNDSRNKLLEIRREYHFSGYSYKQYYRKSVAGF